MILNKIKGFFIKNKKEILFLSFFVIFIFSVGDSAFAETTEKESVSGIIEGINFFIKIFSTIIGLLSALIALLLNPGWVNGTIFGFDTYLKDIWILISNIVYFAFAFILIIIAFMNIIGKGGGSWELKTALPKFVIGVIMVPFTWFFVQFILSISAFLTISVLSLPYDVMESKESFLKIENNRICTEYVFDLTSSTATGSSDENTSSLEECLKDNSGKYTTVGAILRGETTVSDASSSIFSIINIYTYGIMKIQDTTKVSKKQLEKVKTLSGLATKFIFDLIFMVVFLLIIIALFMALFSRGSYLWLYAMFSPIFGLLFFFGKSKEGLSKVGNFGPVEFIKLALVPVYVSAALSFGMIFIFIASNGLSETQNKENSIFSEIEEKGIKYSQIKIGDFKIKVKGTQGGFVTSGDIGTSFNILGDGIGHILLQIFGIVILWMAVMAALRSSEVTGKIIKPIADFGDSIGQLVAKAPQYAPIIPTPGGGMTSAQGLKYGTDNVIGTWENELRTNQSKGIQSLFKGNDSAIHADNASNLISKTNNMNNPEIVKEIRKSISEGKSASYLATLPSFKKAVQEYGEKLLKDDKAKLKDFNNLIGKSDKVSLSRALHLLDEHADKKGYVSIYDKNSTGKPYSPGNLTYLESLTKSGKSSSGTTNADNATKQVQKDIVINDLRTKAEVHTSDGKITEIGTIKIVNGKVDGGKYDKVAEKLINYEKVKTSDKDSFEETFNGLGLDKSETEAIWKEIEKLKKSTT